MPGSSLTEHKPKRPKEAHNNKNNYCLRMPEKPDCQASRVHEKKREKRG
jgi:hypothetical protein